MSWARQMARYFSSKDGLFKSSRGLQNRVCSQGEPQGHSGVAGEGTPVTVGRGGGGLQLTPTSWFLIGRAPAAGKVVFSWARRSAVTAGCESAPCWSPDCLIEVFKNFYWFFTAAFLNVHLSLIYFLKKGIWKGQISTLLHFFRWDFSFCDYPFRVRWSQERDTCFK